MTLPVQAPLVPLLFSGDFLSAAVVLFVVALLAALFGFRGVAGISMAVARVFVFVFLVLAVVALLL